MRRQSGFARRSATMPTIRGSWNAAPARYRFIAMMRRQAARANLRRRRPRNDADGFAVKARRLPFANMSNDHAGIPATAWPEMITQIGRLCPGPTGVARVVDAVQAFGQERQRDWP